MTLDEFLASEAKHGLEKRLEVLFPDEEERKARRPVYDERLNYEIDTIIKMGFSGYFLIVADFIRWPKTMECLSARAGGRVPVLWSPIVF